MWQEDTSEIKKVEEWREQNNKGKERQYTNSNYMALNHWKKERKGIQGKKKSLNSTFWDIIWTIEYNVLKFIFIMIF